MEKKYKNKTSIYHIVGVSLLAFLFTASCIDDSVKPDNSDTIDKAEYNLKIDGEELVGKNIGSNWDSELGIVWLGTDENELPTGTLTIFIDTIVTTSGINQAYISSAILSTVDQLEGTSDEINGKTYYSLSKDELLELGSETGGIQWIDSVVIGANYISGRLGGYVDDNDNFVAWLMKDVNTGEINVLWGTFTAINR